jgi:hypothetical protein
MIKGFGFKFLNVEKIGIRGHQEIFDWFKNKSALFPFKRKEIVFLASPR